MSLGFHYFLYTVLYTVPMSEASGVECAVGSIVRCNGALASVSDLGGMNACSHQM